MDLECRRWYRRGYSTCQVHLNLKSVHQYCDKQWVPFLLLVPISQPVFPTCLRRYLFNPTPPPHPPQPPFIWQGCRAVCWDWLSPTSFFPTPWSAFPRLCRCVEEGCMGSFVLVIVHLRRNGADMSHRLMDSDVCGSVQLLFQIPWFACHWL